MIATEKDLERIAAWNRTEVGEAPTTAVALFTEVARATPDAIAVEWAAGSLDYATLDARSNGLARKLVDLGVKRGDRVALVADRSAASIVALLAILKAGAAYLPIEPSYPRDRVAFMFDDAAPSAVIVAPSLASRVPPSPARTLLLDDRYEGAAPPAVEITPLDLVYVMYTSGSTGKPKGVGILHRAIPRLVQRVRYAKLDRGTVLLHAAPLAFDASTFEIWGALLNGGRVVLHDETIPTARGLKATIERFGVTTAWLTAGLFNAVVDEDPRALAGLSELLIGGEALSVPHVRRALASLPKTQIINGYGPTECTTFAACFPIPRDLDDDTTSIPIGAPIRETTFHVLDDTMKPVAIGDVGELYVGGSGLGRGYLGRAELTAERFVDDPRRPGDKLYRTGDLVRWRPEGVVDYVGRIDAQVKIRGFRIELGEIEAAIARHAAVRANVVAAIDGAHGLKRLVAYVVPSGEARPALHELASFLRETLPDYMVPTALVFLEAIPVTANGKIDRRALPAPPSERPTLQTEFAPSSTPLEAKICAAFERSLGVTPIGANDNFFDLGASSLLVVRTVASLRNDGVDVPVLRVFEHPTARALAGFVERGGREDALADRIKKLERIGGSEPIAIVGVACRVPGANGVDALWEVLRKGRDTIRLFRDDEIDPAVPRELRSDPAYVKARGVLDDVDLFDAGFFGISPREADVMDPQQRVILELAWEALERAGHVPASFDGSIGVWAGKYNDSYYAENVAKRPEVIQGIGAFQTMIANEKDYVATRIAHRLDCRGPAISVHTACSTSLVAIVQAMRSLQRGESDLALAGGVSITVPVKSGHLYQEGSMLSSDGHTRTFDADASGTVFSDGAAMVALRRLSDAIADGDTIHATIVGGAINNDGGAKASFTAPSVEGQATVVAMAHADAKIDPRSISYVEAHGTATPLGDPIEIEALTRAFRLRTSDDQFCAIGSIKSNLGHTVIAAGAIGVIKTALAMEQELLPASLHFKSPNPKLDLERTPFRVQSVAAPWRRTKEPRRAGVSSFGVGGTNAHVVMEEAPRAEALPDETAPQLLVLSTRSAGATQRAAKDLGDHLAARSDRRLADVAFTLQLGRASFSHRLAVVASSSIDAAKKLAEAAALPVTRARSTPPRVALLFPGQGAQYLGMGSKLAESSPVFRASIDRVALAVNEIVGRDLREVMWSGSAESLRETRFTQPALFAIEWALATTFESVGVKPALMIGHSVGEFVAAVVAGVMKVEDAARLVAERGRLMQSAPRGSMLSVRSPVDRVAPRLRGQLGIASENGPSLCVVAGPTPEIEALQRELEADGLVAKPLHTSHAFHSPMMDALVEPFTKIVQSIELRAPRVPFVSTVTGEMITEAEATSAAYWGRHLRAPVRFSAGVARLWREPDVLLLEVGPRTTLATLARQQVTDRAKQTAVSSLADTPEVEVASLLGAMGQLWTHGVAIDFRALHGAARRRRVPLPTYPFERARHWVDAPTAPATASASAPATASVASPSAAVRTPIEVPSMSSSRLADLKRKVAEVFEETSGIEIRPDDESVSFVELGFDSLFLTQVAIATQKRFSVKLTFRQLTDALSSLDRVAEYIAEQQPSLVAGAPEPAPAQPIAASAPTAAPMMIAQQIATPMLAAPIATNAPPGSLQSLIEQQLRVMTAQLAILQGTPIQAALPVAFEQPAQQHQHAPAPAIASTPSPVAHSPLPSPLTATSKDDEGTKKPFGAIARISSNKEEIAPKQRARLDAFIRRYNARTKKSKEHTEENRSFNADPRVVTGFRPLVKEITYPVVIQKSKGPRLWDLDGNEYVDCLNGFGCNLFGWQPGFVVEAMKQQLDTGYEIGPQTPLAAECARLVCELTGFDRAAFCNTGSEAVMGTMRIARTVTGRNKIALFTGSYHGIFDEVIVRATKRGAIPAAPGIMAPTAQNVLVLDYGTPEALETIKKNGDEIAAVLVEPIQSRRPDFRPREFLHTLRDLTHDKGMALIFDEVITGFRMGNGGAQAFYDVRADLASYGKVIGGGMSVGVIAGKRQFMDALDGGAWQFGDTSIPTVGVTYFAGTFVRHPLALAALRAVAHRLKADPGLAARVSARTDRLAAELNAFFKSAGAPLEIRHFASLWKTFYTEEHPLGDILFALLRERGLHIMDGFPCFLTTEHGDAEVDFIVKCFKEAVHEMQESGFLPEPPRKPTAAPFDASSPPAPGARLGRDQQGNPAWFVLNPNNGKYDKLDLPS